MPAVQKPVTFSWVPKGAGKGGQFSNATSHDSDTDYMSAVSEFLVDGGRWTIVPFDLLLGNTNFVSPVAANSLTIYNAFGATTSADWLMYSGYDAVNQANWIGYFSTAGVSYHLTSQAPNTVPPYPATFQTVKNKCYASFGYTGTQTLKTSGPLIIYDAAGAGNPPQFAKWGIQAPTTNLQVTATSFEAGTGDASSASQIVTNIAGFTPTTHLSVGMPFYIETSAGSGAFSQYTISSVGATTVTLTTKPAENYTGAKVQGNYGSMSWGVTTPQSVSGTGDTTGIIDITNVSFDPTIQCKVGYNLFIEAAAGTNRWNEYRILAVTNTPSNKITLTTVTAETYVGAKIRVDLPTATSVNSADSTYRYAVAYYDTVRGHVGDRGPEFEVTFGPPFNNRIDLIVQNICDYEKTPDPYISVYPIYDKIILYRTSNAGGVLLPRTLLPKAGAGAGYIQSFTDNLGDDTQLNLVAPYVGAAAPGTHAPPPRDINYATYWEGRFFASSTSNPGILYWSSLASEVGNYGVPEECWNPLSTLPVPQSDGVITGIKTVGPALMILTQNNIYQVLYNGAGSAPTFRLQRISCKGSGTSQFATTTLPGEDSNSGDILVHFGNDRRLYLLYGQGGDIPISYPIQDVLNANSVFASSANVQLGIKHDKRATYIVMICGQNGLTFLYDIDRKIWLNLYANYTAFTEGLWAGAMTSFVSTPGGDVFQFMSNTVSIPATNHAALTTQFVSPPGVPRLDEKQLQATVVYADGWSPAGGFGAPTVTAYLDEGAVAVPFTRITTSLDLRFQAYLDAPDAMLFVPQGYLLSGRTFRISFTGLPNAVVTYVSEMTGLWGVTVDPASTGGVV